MSEAVEFLILGGGPTGLGAAWRLLAHGRRDWRLYEAAPEPGGLATSVVDEHGFTWDLGGHVQFSHYQHFDDLMDELLGADGWLYHDRSSWVWMRGGFVPYPFQLNLRHLPVEDQCRAVAGMLALLRQPFSGTPANFGEWIDATFGKGIAEIFMRPYNFKVWAWPPEEMAWHWIGDRVAVVDVERAVENLLRGRDERGWGPNNRFRFPKRGGTGAIWKALAERIETAAPGQIRLACPLVRLDTTRRIAHFGDGSAVTYGKLLSTIPLDRLVALSDLAGGAAGEYHQAASRLRRSSTHIIGVGLYGSAPEHLGGKCWMYFPEADCPFYRVTVFSHYSPENVPDIRRYWSLMAEVAESPVKPVDGERVVGETLDGMVATRLIPGPEAVHHTWYRRLPYGYPTPSLSRDEALAVLLPAFEARQVYSRGRFGAWKYEVSNQDHTFSQGVEVVDRWLAGGEEETLNHPERVNARRSRPRALAAAVETGEEEGS